MPFLIDGYNLLHAMDLLPQQTGPDGLRKARTALLGRLAGALGAQASEVTVVFDAANAPPDAPDRLVHRRLHVLFAKDEQQADDLITKLISGCSAPQQLTVVSDDRELVKTAEACGCRTMRCEEFLAWLDRRYARHAPPSPESQAKTQGLTEAQAAPWLREFADLDEDPSLGEPLFPDLDDPTQPR
jgi:predicted RNA-binding protein with PIN domain